MSTIKLTQNKLTWFLTVARPEAMNALSHQVLADLDGALNTIAGKALSECRALVVTGAGDKSFIAGADIKEVSQMNLDQSQKFSSFGQSLIRKIETLKIPVIAAVNGFALGGGLELALACDFLYASQNAKFGLPEVSLGLMPGFGGTVRLSRIVGMNRAKELLMAGDMWTAAQAYEYGLATKVVRPDELMSSCLKLAESLMSKGPLALANCKRSAIETFDQNIDLAMETENKIFAELFSTQDLKEGTRAFIEKRRPQFQGK